MKDHNKWIIFFIGLTIIGTVGLFALLRTHKTEQPLPSYEPLAKEGANLTTENLLVEVPVVTPENDIDTDQAKHFTINIQYPKISLIQYPTLAKEANDVIAAFVANIKNDFKKHIDEMPPNDVRKDFTNDLTMRFTPLLLSPTIISIRFDTSEYIAGAPHPNNHVRILNYNFSKHLVLSPADLFASSTQALPFLSTYSRSALRTLFVDMTEEELVIQMIPGTAPTHENFREVGITKTGLVVLFDPYQVAPYARGVLEVKIPLADMHPPREESELISYDVKEAIRMATENIVEATPTE